MYVFNKKIISAFCLAFISSLHAAHKGTVQKVRDRTGALVELTLPFPYKHLTTSPETGLPVEGGKDEQVNLFSESTVFIPELFYAVLGKNSKIKSAIVGPCNPCVAIAVRDVHRDKTVVLHGYILPFYKRITDVIDKEFGESLQHGEVKIFITRDKSYPGLDDHRKLFLSNLSEIFVKKYKIKKQQVKTTVNEITGLESGSLLSYADRTIYTDKDLNFSSTCYHNEHIFFNNSLLGETLDHSLLSAYFKTFSFYRKNSADKDPSENLQLPFAEEHLKKMKETEGFPFFQICESTAGLKWLPFIAGG